LKVTVQVDGYPGFEQSASVTASSNALEAGPTVEAESKNPHKTLGGWLFPSERRWLA
jgi:hypothetical protein